MIPHILTNKTNAEGCQMQGISDLEGISSSYNERWARKTRFAFLEACRQQVLKMNTFTRRIEVKGVN